MEKVRSLTFRENHKTRVLLLLPLIAAQQGWRKCFRYGACSTTFGYLDQFAWRRSVRWLRKRHLGLNLGKRRDGIWRTGRFEIDDPRCFDSRRLQLFARESVARAPPTMDDFSIGINRIGGRVPRRARCGESRTSGSGGGPERPIGRDDGRALRSNTPTLVPNLVHLY